MSLEARNLSFFYGKKAILQDVFFSLEPGTVNALLGQNGAGKSTLFHLLSGIKKPKEGEIFLEGKALKEMSSKERAQKIATLTQSFEGGGLSVFDYLLLGRLPYFSWNPSPLDKEAVVQILFEMGIAAYRDRNVDELSGGEKQRVGIARAMVGKPQVLLLDEPTASLDVKARLEFLQKVEEIADSGTCVLLCLHDINEAYSVADRFLFLKETHLAYDVSKKDLNEKILSDIYEVDAAFIQKEGGAYIEFQNKKGTNS